MIYQALQAPNRGGWYKVSPAPENGLLTVHKTHYDKYHLYPSAGKGVQLHRLPNFLFEAPTFKPLSNEAKENRQKITDNCCSKAIVTVGRKVAASELAGELVKDEVFFIKGGGVTLSGGEPLMQSEFCERILDILGKKDINRAIETSLYAPYEKCFRVLKKCEQIYIDMKFFSADDHLKFTGKSNEIIKK